MPLTDFVEIRRKGKIIKSHNCDLTKRCTKCRKQICTNCESPHNNLTSSICLECRHLENAKNIETIEQRVDMKLNLFYLRKCFRNE